ncbi:rod shape-determining protein MreC [Methylotenera sp. 1P/1]|jgi:rod shape-determining protein MreC|uniref:rod shape-determining protein MreC n=1 Tax=Methylotenera sp. 1P/1 TaxID=1131551 RepID=UPI00035F04A9|nr:rod shape-determining protein MreC [Methylotenera sp. 1P/1]
MLKGVHQKLEPQESPAFFVRGPSPFSRIMFFCALSIVLMAVDSRLDYLSQFRQTFIAALHPLEMVANAPSEWGLNIRQYFTAHSRLLIENQALKQQAVEHNVMLQRLATIELENAHLKTLLKGNAPMIPKAILGEILHMGRDPFSNVVVINRGSQHTVEAGQAVVDAQGVVGQVTRVFPFSAEVTLITDKNLSIPIQVERNQLRAIAFGEGKSNTIDLPFLPTSVDIKVGDKLVTSGIDGVYPAGLAVAKVTEVRQSPDSPFAKIISTPIAGVNNHLQLLILSMPTPAEHIEAAPASVGDAAAPPATATTSIPPAKPRKEKPHASR